MPEARVLLGVVGRPHGVRGLLRVHSYTSEPEALAEYGPLSDEAGRRWTLAWRAPGVAELRDEHGLPVPDRTAAEHLVNTKLFVDRDALPVPGEDEFYLADLIGMEAIHSDGRQLGPVTAVHDYGAGASIEVGPLLVPFTRACVPEVDLSARRVVLEPPAELVVPTQQAGEA